MTGRTALLLSGHTRSLDWTAENLSELAVRIGCDVFVHTWTEPEMKAPTWRAPENYGEVAGVNALLRHGIQPKLIVREDSNPEAVVQLFRAHGVDLDVSAIKGCHYMLYGMWKAHELLERYAQQHKINYSKVVRYRFDLCCADFDSLVDDLNFAQNNPKVLLAPPHNWARALGASFDGIIIAASPAYAKFMRALLSRFHGHHQQLLQRERFIPELLIFESARDIGLDIAPTSGEYSIVRAGGRVEQSFCYNVPSLMQRLRESAAAYVVITETSTAWQASYLYGKWEKHSSPLLRKFVSIAYRPYKLIKNRITSRA